MNIHQVSTLARVENQHERARYIQKKIKIEKKQQFNNNIDNSSQASLLYNRSICKRVKLCQQHSKAVTNHISTEKKNKQKKISTT